MMFDYYKILLWDHFTEKYFQYVRDNVLKKIDVKTHHDLACGSGYFVDRVNNLGIASSWSNISHQQIEIAQERYTAKNYTIKDMANLSLDTQVDFITCNNDAINHLYSFQEWRELFTNVYNNLNKKGFFLFDYHTLEKINNTKYTKNTMRVEDFSIEDIEESIGNNFYRSSWTISDTKTGEVKLILKSYHTSFSHEEIQNTLTEVWFKKILHLDLSTKDRVYILAFKY